LPESAARAAAQQTAITPATANVVILFMSPPPADWSIANFSMKAWQAIERLSPLHIRRNHSFVDSS
jgi:hypothetical protein